MPSPSSVYDSILLGALNQEADHVRAMALGLDVHGLAASMMAAAWGAAQRFVRDHASLADKPMRAHAARALEIADAMPGELRLLWQLHYVDGYPLSVYATATDATHETSQDDYRAVVRAVQAALRVPTGGEQPGELGRGDP